jgi:hypothetical protein
MPLSTGARPGPYETLAPTGAGGMGELYRAHDRVSAAGDRPERGLVNEHAVEGNKVPQSILELSLEIYLRNLREMPE